MQKVVTLRDVQALAARNARIAKATSQLRGLGEPIRGLKHLEMLPKELRNKQLHSAIDAGDYDLVVRALDAKADPNSRVNGWSAMNRAVYLRDNEAEADRPIYERIVNLLVARGATPEKSMEQRAGELLHAIDAVDEGGVREILRTRLNPDTVVKGWTALGRAHYLINMEEHKSLGERLIRKIDALWDIVDMLEDKGAEERLEGERSSF